MKNYLTNALITISIMILQCLQNVNAQSWNLTGNAGTNASTNFVGTTDNVALRFRTKNVNRMSISSGGKVGIGITTPAFKLDVKGGSINTDSVYRIGGISVLSIKGANNTFVGSNSGFSNTTGYENTANGDAALYSNTTGHWNTALGFASLTFNKAGSGATAVGTNAMYYSNNSSIPFVSYCVAIGYEALKGSTNAAANTGNYNSAVGYQTLWSYTTGNNNTANGYQALYYNTTGSGNTAIGYGALLFNAAGSNGTALGSNAMYYANSTSSAFTNENVAVGFEALRGSTSPAANIGNSNTAIGYQALRNNSSGYANTASGDGVLYTNTTGYNNTATGWSALFANTSGYSNTAHGLNALQQNTTGNNNTASGVDALVNTTTGFQNTSVGSNSLVANTTGSYNTALGYNTGPNSTAYVNTTCLGIDATATASNMVRIGNTFVTSIGGYQGWTTLPSDRRFKQNVREDVSGLNFIMKLKPVTYEVDVNGINHFLGKEDSDKYETAGGDKSAVRYSGFIAQDVEQAARESGYDFSGVDKPKNENDFYGLRYAEFVVPLVKAVQELNKELKLEVENLKSEIRDMKSGMKQTAIQNRQSEMLFQNTPNPFSEKTIINYNVPPAAQNAVINIYAADGKELNAYNITSAGKGQIEITGNALAAGIYNYTLFIDGKATESRQMVLTK